MSKNSVPVERFGYTQAKVVKFKYTWTINNYRMNVNKSLLSPTFSIDSNKSLTAFLEIYEHIEDDVDDPDCEDEYVGILFFIMSDIFNKGTKVECKYSILNGSGYVVQEKVTNDFLRDLDHYSDSDSVYSDTDHLSCPILISKTDLLKNLAAVNLNQSMTVIFELCISPGSENDPNQIVISESVSPDPLKLLFENPLFSDITLSANGTDFKVHKAILATQSQVFAAMFNANMQESFSNRVEINDLNEVTLRELLRFIYTGKVLNFDEMIEDLLWAADKYAIRSLKVMCEIELNRQLSITNALSIFTLADMHSSSQLKSYVKNFIRVHLLDVINTNEWKILKQKHPNLAKEILITP